MAEPQSFWSQRNRYRQLMVPGLSLVAIILLTVLVMIPQIQNAVADRRETLELRVRVAVLKQKSEVLANLDVVELNIRSDKLAAALPSTNDLGYFLLGVRSMAERAGVLFQGMELVGVERTAVTEASGVPAIARRQTQVRKQENVARILVQLSGDIEQLRRFLQEVEESIPLAHVDEFSFGNVDADGFLRARVTLKYFYSPVPDALGKAEQELPVVSAAEEQVYRRILELREPDVVELPRVPTGNQNLFL